MGRRVLLISAAALLLALSLRPSGAQSGPIAPIILAIPSLSQSPATPTPAVSGSTVTGSGRGRNDYTGTPVGDPFSSIAGAGGVLVDPFDPEERCVAVPGGTNVLGHATDQLCVSMDGFLTPFSPAADNPGFRSESGCLVPSDLLDVASAGPAYDYIISGAFECLSQIGRASCR